MKTATKKNTDLVPIEGEPRLKLWLKRMGKAEYKGIEKVKNRWRIRPSLLARCKKQFQKSRTYEVLLARLHLGSKVDDIEAIVSCGLLVKGNPRVVLSLEFLEMELSEARRLFPELIQE